MSTPTRREFLQAAAGGVVGVAAGATLIAATPLPEVVTSITAVGLSISVETSPMDQAAWVVTEFRSRSLGCSFVTMEAAKVPDGAPVLSGVEWFTDDMFARPTWVPFRRQA